MSAPVTSTSTRNSQTPTPKPPPLGQATNEIADADLSTSEVDQRKKILAKYKYSKTGLELTETVKNWYRSCKAQRAQTQKQWEYNLTMYAGNQWAELTPRNGIRTPAAPRHRVRSKTNRLRPIIRTEVSRMTSQKPSASFTPVSGSEDDMFAAQAAEAVWESLYSRKKLHQLDIRVAWWTAITGNAFKKTFWDPTIVDKTFLTVNPVYATPEPTVGDLSYSLVTPFNLFVPDLLVEDIEDQPYVIEAYTKPVEWVTRFWGDYLDKPVQPSVVGRSEIFEARYFTAQDSQEAKPDAVLVIEAYLKPGAHASLPNGGMITIVGEELVQFIDEWPYSHGEYPHAHVKHIPTGRFYADSVLVDLIPLQVEYNRTRSQIIEHKIRNARTQLMYERGSINPKLLTSEPGALVEVMPGRPMPIPLPAQPIPPSVVQELDTIKQDMEDISGQHQASRGNSPGGGVVAATAISYLQDMDDSLMYATYASIEAAYEKQARHSLAIVADKWDLAKIIQTTGTDGAFDSLELKGSDIARGLDVRAESGSALPTQKAARQAFLMDMAKMGFISPDQLLDLIDMGGTKKLTEVIRVDMKAAQRENLKMKKLSPTDIMQADLQYEQSLQPDPITGEVNPDTIDQTTGMTLERGPIVPVNEWDNHMAHVEVHNRYRKSQEFELLDPAVKAEFARHIMHHKVQMMFMAGGMVGNGDPSMMGMPPGGQGQPGGGDPSQGGMPPGMMPPGMEGMMPGMDPTMASVQDAGPLSMPGGGM